MDANNELPTPFRLGPSYGQQCTELDFATDSRCYHARHAHATAWHASGCCSSWASRPCRNSRSHRLGAQFVHSLMQRGVPAMSLVSWVTTHYQFIARSSLLEEVHCSKLIARSSLLEAASLLEAHCSRLIARGSLLEVHCSKFIA